MNQCTATTLFLPPADIAAQIPIGHSAHSGHLLCELGEHDGNGDHAKMLWDNVDTAVWARWNNQRGVITEMPWCPELNREGDACGKFARHPSAHAWEVTDPTVEAFLAAEFGPPQREED